jgi:hypothetical protein
MRAKQTRQGPGKPFFLPVGLFGGEVDERDSVGRLIELGKVIEQQRSGPGYGPEYIWVETID